MKGAIAIPYESTSRWARLPWTVILISLVAGALGVWLGVAGLALVRHVSQDHQALHELAVIELQRQQASRPAPGK
jgi:hypothetical protein